MTLREARNLALLLNNVLTDVPDSRRLVYHLERELNSTFGAHLLWAIDATRNLTVNLVGDLHDVEV